MVDKAAPKAMGGLSNREQEILVAALSKCLKNGDIQIDYTKLAAETGLKDARVASATWSPIKKKLFGIASAQAGTTSGTASKVTKTKTPRTLKESEEPKEPKTPSSTTKKAAKSAVHSDEEQDAAAFGEDTSEIESKVKVKVNVSNCTDASSALKAETNGNEEPTTEDADGDSTMVDTPEPIEKVKGKTTVIDDMSSGDMSPPATPAPTKAKKAAAPKPKATPKTPKTPTGGDSGTAINDAAETPVPGSSGAKKRGRKTKAQKEAEAAAAGENGTTENGEDDEAEKPAKKPRKTPAKKVKKGGVAEDGETAGAGEGEAGEKETPIKKPRKAPVKKAKKEEAAEDGGAADAGVENGEDGEKEKPVKKPRKTPVKKEKKKEEAAPAGEVSPVGEAVKEKKKPGPKPGAAKAKKAVTPADLSEDEEQEKICHEAVAKVIKDAKLTNDVLDGKNVETKATSTTSAILPSRDWGTPINGNSPSSTKAQVIVQLGKEYAAASGTANGEDDGDTIAVGSEAVQSIETEDDESGNTITVATA